MNTRILLLLLAGAACHGADTGENSTRLTVSAETAFASRYLWRGYVVNDSPSLQPSVTVTLRGFSATAWSNFSRTVPNNQAWTETDLSLEYARDVGRFSLYAGLLDYYYPDLPSPAQNRSREITFGVAYDTVLSPSFRVYRDVSGGAGNYFFLGAEHVVSLHRQRRVSLELAGGIGLNQHLYLPVTAVSDVDFTATLNVPAGKLVFSPFVACMAGHRELFGKHSAFGIKLAFAP